MKERLKEDLTKLEHELRVAQEFRDMYRDKVRKVMEAISPFQEAMDRHQSSVDNLICRINCLKQEIYIAENSKP